MQASITPKVGKARQRMVHGASWRNSVLEVRFKGLVQRIAERGGVHRSLSAGQAGGVVERADYHVPLINNNTLYGKRMESAESRATIEPRRKSISQRALAELRLRKELSGSSSQFSRDWSPRIVFVLVSLKNVMKHTFLVFLSPRLFAFTSNSTHERLAG